MTPERTELEFTYEPADFFEAPYRSETAEYDLLFEEGAAVATLRSVQNPVDAVLEKKVATHIQNILLARQLQVRCTYKLQGPRISQYGAGKKDVAIRIGSDDIVAIGDHADHTVTDPAGHIIRDTRAQRIAEESAALDLLAPGPLRSPTLRGILESYSRSISDPGDELVHLYEVRDALSAHYGNEVNARTALGITKGEWGVLGLLANVEPLEEGRHRGKQPVRRPATQAELEKARRIVRHWIMAFAQKL